jgi:putative NADPH-quinone reductase
MRVFIVHAHHEPTSFSGALTREAQSILPNARHEIAVSDLYAMRFDPVSDRRNFKSVKNPDRLSQQAEEAFASEHDSFVPELQSEMDKVAWCDALVFQFPLWWLGLPAILKGWVDRVFAIGRAYGGGRYFERGVFRGKRAMCSVTVGGRIRSDRQYALSDSPRRPELRGIFSRRAFRRARTCSNDAVRTVRSDASVWRAVAWPINRANFAGPRYRTLRRPDAQTGPMSR